MTTKTVLADSAKNTFNLLKEWRNSKSDEDEYRRRAKEVLRQTADETRRMRNEKPAEIGKAVATAGASGVRVSSFDDAFLSADLETAKKAYDKEDEARSEAYELRRKAEKERRGRRDKAFSYSVGLITNLGGF